MKKLFSKIVTSILVITFTVLSCSKEEVEEINEAPVKKILKQHPGHRDLIGRHLLQFFLANPGNTLGVEPHHCLNV